MQKIRSKRWLLTAIQPPFPQILISKDGGKTCHPSFCLFCSQANGMECFFFLITHLLAKAVKKKLTFWIYFFKLLIFIFMGVFNRKSSLELIKQWMLQKLTNWKNIHTPHPVKQMDYPEWKIQEQLEPLCYIHRRKAQEYNIPSTFKTQIQSPWKWTIH